MSVSSEIERIEGNISAAYTAASAKDATLPATQNSENLATCISSITGGVQTITATNTTSSSISSGDKVWLNKNGNTYNIVDYYGDSPNFKTNGTPSIVNKAASNFDLSNYLISYTKNNTFTPATGNTWELVLKFKYNSNFDYSTTPYYFWYKPDTSRYGLAIGTYIDSDNKIRLWLDLSTDGVSWTSWNGWDSDYSGWDNFTFELDTIYWIRLSWDGTDYKLEYSTDGINFALGSTYSDIGLIAGAYPLTEIHIGEYYQLNSAQYMTIYLDGCYGKINGITRWSPYLPNIDENSIMGKASANISAGNSGNINIL